MSEWIDCGTYWLNTSDQRGTRWHDIRAGRITASNFGSAIGHSIFTTPDELADQILGITDKQFTPEQLERMKKGTDGEPIARDWYARTRGVVVKEVGIAIPKWNLMIGGSLDGNIENSDGCIEIKCVEQMYKPLLRRMNNPTPSTNYDHIWKTHFDQMQGCMGITEKKWCDYIVYCAQHNLVYVERIPFVPKYWNEVLYPGLVNFLETKIIPRLTVTIIVP